MTRYWKPTAGERRAIRGYAARCEHLKPQQVSLDVAQRYNLANGAIDNSFNVYLVDQTPDWEESDLDDLWSFSNVKAIPLTDDGRALIDIYVYENDEDRELLTNVQAYAETVDGKPKLVKLVSTMGMAAYGDDLRILMG